MDSCPYYHEHGVKPHVIPCCNHKHAPVPCFKDVPSAGSRRPLGCGGRLSHCEIPRNKQLDVS